MAKIFDDPCQQARQELLESSEDGDYEDGGLKPFRRDDEEDGAQEKEEALSLCETFHYLLYSDQPDPEWEEVNRKILAGARPAGAEGFPSCSPLAAALLAEARK